MPDDRELSPEALKVLNARKAAAAELQQMDGAERPLNDPLVMRLAGARLYEAGITMRVVSGEPVSASEFKAATDMVEQARAAIPPKPIECKLEIVHNIGLCPSCGYKLENHEPPARPEPPKRETRELAKPDASRSVPAPVANVVPLRRFVSDSAFHDQPGTPLKKLQPFGYTPSHVHTHFGSGVLSETNPSSGGTAHPLPPIPWE